MHGYTVQIRTDACLNQKQHFNIFCLVGYFYHSLTQPVSTYTTKVITSNNINAIIERLFYFIY